MEASLAYCLPHVFAVPSAQRLAPPSFRPSRHAMRNTSSLLQSCIALLLCIGLLAQAQHDTSNEDEVVAPLVLPEVKALPAYSFRGPFPEGAKIGGFEVTGQA